jgi:1-aminocyclopropane-1-carboxylate deaminase/D-cysteine desulfhydrase-like pyridoxal-dependent ACC family enzyme
MPSAAFPLSTSDLRGAIGRLPRYLLGHYPTPLEYAERFSKALGGPQVFIKRDDCTGLAFGGNKTRHNEFLIADALRQGADIIVWGAGVQSNNCRQTAAACAKAGLDIHLVLGRGGPAGAPTSSRETCCSTISSARTWTSSKRKSASISTTASPAKPQNTPRTAARSIPGTATR